MIKATIYDTEFCHPIELNFQTKEQLHDILTLNPRFEVEDLIDVA